MLLAEYGEGGQDTEALRLGAADFLVKGETTAPQLRRAVMHAIERARVSRALRESEARLLQAERTESLGRLAGGIAHDFNNLLTGILSCTSTLEQQIDADHPAREPIDAVRRTAELAARLARQLLAYGGRQTIEPTEIDLNRVVEGLAEMLRRLVGDHLTFDVATTRPLPLVVADRSQMEQVVMNLVLNARDATPPGGRITIRTGDADDRGHRGRARAARSRRRVRLGVGRGHRLRHVERGRWRAPSSRSSPPSRRAAAPGSAWPRPTAAWRRAAGSCASAASSASARR